MKVGVRPKFLQHKNLKEKLLKTKGKMIIENSPYDSFWGTGKAGLGFNVLGMILVQLRTQLNSIK